MALRPFLEMTQNSCWCFLKKGTLLLGVLLATSFGGGSGSSSSQGTNLHRRKPAVLMGRGNAHRGVHRRWRGSRAVRATSRARVVLGTAPAQPDTRVPNRIPLHLVDGHLGSVALDELDETAALAGRDLDVGNLAKALEERPQLILGDIAREAANKDSGVVGIGELVHGLRSTVEAHGGSAHRGVHPGGTGHAHSTGHHTRALVLGGSRGDAHGAVAAVDTLHLGQSTLLIVLIGEADKTIAARHSTDGVGHDLGGLAGRESALEEGNQDIFVDLGAQVANEDGVLGATVITAIESVSGRGLGLSLESYLRSARPPPVAQLSLKTRLVLGMGVPFRDRALVAAAGDAKSTKQ